MLVSKYNLITRIGNEMGYYFSLKINITVTECEFQNFFMFFFLLF